MPLLNAAADSHGWFYYRKRNKKCQSISAQMFLLVGGEFERIPCEFGEYLCRIWELHSTGYKLFNKNRARKFIFKVKVTVKVPSFRIQNGKVAGRSLDS